MTFSFTDNLPDELSLQPILISGFDSSQFNGQQYLIINQNDNTESVYKIRYEYHCSPFKQAFIVDNILAVGHEGAFYLFNLTTNTNFLRLRMEGYFGHLYFDNELFYVADAGGLYCIDKNGSIHWQNNNLAIDGVVINNFTDDKLFGSGESDPPGGWRDFILDKQTGIKTK